MYRFRTIHCAILLLAGMLAAGPALAAERQAMRLDDYRWAFAPAVDPTSPTGWQLPRDCGHAQAELRALLPAELAALLAEARERTVAQSGRSRNWTQSEFLDFNDTLTALVEQRFPAQGGFYPEFRGWLLRAWALDGERPRIGWARILCDPARLAGVVSAPNRFDALVLQLSAAHE